MNRVRKLLNEAYARLGSWDAVAHAVGGVGGEGLRLYAVGETKTMREKTQARVIRQLGEDAPTFDVEGDAERILSQLEAAAEQQRHYVRQLRLHRAILAAVDAPTRTVPPAAGPGKE